MSATIHLHTWTIRFDKALQPIVERIALEEDRRVSDVVRLLLAEALRHRGLVPDPRITTNNFVKKTADVA